MLTVKGFIEVPSFINNAKDQTAAIGELGRKSRTFSRDRQRYSDPDKDSGELVIFHCASSGNYTVLPSDIKDLCLDIIEEAYNDFTTSQTFLDQLIGAFPQLDNVQTGVDKIHSGRALTDWFSFEYTDGGSTTKVKLWLSNQSFEAEYDEYELHVVAPAVNIESYKSTYENALAAKESFTLSLRSEVQRDIIGESPPTDVRIVELNWVDPSDSSNALLTEWSIVGYGPQAAVYENMLEAIRKHLLDNSSYDLSTWIQYFPELDNVDIIYLFPQWDNVALTSSAVPGTGDNLYATYVRYDLGVDNLRKILTGTSLTSMKKYIDVITSIQKSIALFAVGKETNSVGTQRLSDIHPRYSVLNINDINLSRLPATTKSFIKLLSQLLAQAEADEGVGTLPSGMVRQNTGGVIFLEVVLNNVTYRLCTKQSYLSSI